LNSFMASYANKQLMIQQRACYIYCR